MADRMARVAAKPARRLSRLPGQRPIERQRPDELLGQRRIQRQPLRRRLNGGWTEAGRRLGGGWPGAGRRLDKGWTEAGRRLNGLLGPRRIERRALRRSLHGDWTAAEGITPPAPNQPASAAKESTRRLWKDYSASAGIKRTSAQSSPSPSSRRSPLGPPLALQRQTSFQPPSHLSADSVAMLAVRSAAGLVTARLPRSLSAD